MNEKKYKNLYIINYKMLMFLIEYFCKKNKGIDLD